jgi:exonuclease SbcC
MQLQHLTLRGFTGLSRGSGIEELDLDLAQIRGIVVLVGPNGSGKTTTLENLQPFRALPSRNIGLKDAVWLRDAAKDLRFTLDGRHYRVLVTVDAHTGKSDGFCWCDDQPLTSGKISELDEQLQRLLGSPEWFFQSVFAAQGAASLLSLRPAMRKDFFAEFLGLDHLQAAAERARQVAVFLEAWNAGLRAEAQRLRQEVDELPLLEQRLAARQQEATVHESVLSRVCVHEQQCRARVDAVRRQVLQAQEAAQRLRTWEQQHARIMAAATRQETTIQTERRRAHAEIARVHQARTALDTRIAAIATQERTADEIDHERATLKTVIARCEAELQTIHRAAEAERDLSQAEAQYQQRLATLSTTLTERQRLAIALTSRPAEAPESLCRGCGLAQAAWQARDETQTLATQCERLQTEHATALHALRTAIPQGCRPRAAVEAELTAVREQLQILEQFRVQQQDHARLREERATAETTLQTVQEALSRLDAALAEVQQQRAADLQRVEEELANARAACMPDMSEQVRVAEQQLAAATQQVIRQTETLADTRAAFSLIIQQIAERNTRRPRLQQVQTQLRHGEAEQAEWVLLAQLCGRDRLQAVELDAAAPAISQYCNLLLGQCFGGRFALTFRTLDAQGREVFDLVVRDSRSGEERELRLMSGGEQTLILHAVRLALTLYAKERSARDFRTIFCDEVDGQLYSETRREFLAMNRAAMRLGSFDTMFLVSHSPEILDGADHVITFTHGSVTLT